MSRCAAIEGGVRCRSEATGTLSLACVHEHLSVDEPLCDRCAALTRQYLAEKAFTCDPCRYSAEPHECLTYEIRPAHAMTT